MKKITVVLLLILFIGSIGAIDIESYTFIDRLLSFKGPDKPVVFEDGVIFTASSSHQRVGVAFAHEGFAKIHWFQKLVLPETNPAAQDPKKKNEPLFLYRDSGILFHAYTVPEEIKELEYRMVINGVWTIDPQNPVYRFDTSGLGRSVISMPVAQKKKSLTDGPPGTLSFSYDASAGESITVAGNFNSWDPFMYELQERSPGHYSLILQLPPGTYQYAFFHRGERVLDPNNANTVYTKEGKAASVVVIK
jgi:hypothetical protein